jgi:hypothetical protein
MDLTQFTPEQIAALKQALQETESGRTNEFRPRQLHDLRKLPAHNDARPLFIWSAESPVNFNPAQVAPFAQLAWAPPDRTGFQVEVTAHSREELDAYVAKGYQLTPPVGQEIDPLEQIHAQFEALSPEDQQLLIEAQAQDKRAQLQKALASLSVEEIEKLVSSTKKARKKTA